VRFLLLLLLWGSGALWGVLLVLINQALSLPFLLPLGDFKFDVD
jgi:hypothetical protein